MMSHRLLFLVLAIFMVSCSDGPLIQAPVDVDPVPEERPDGEEEYFDSTVPANTVEIGDGIYVEPGLHLRPGIRIFDLHPDFNNELTLNNEMASAELRGDARGEIEQIAEGDIFITSELIARVVRIDEKDDSTVLILSDFQIWDVVHGEWSLEMTLDREGEDIYPIDDSDYAVRRQMLSQTHEINYSTSSGGVALSANASLSFGASPNLRFEGKIPFYESSSGYNCSDPQVKVDIGCVPTPFGTKCAKRYRYCVDYLSLTVDIGADLSADATLTATASKSYEYPENKRLVEKGLGQVPLTGPFFLRPSFYLDRQAYVEASLEGELTMSAGAGANLPIGFEYRNGGGYSLIPNASNGPTTYANLSGSATLEAKLEAGLWAEAGLVLAICTPDIPADVCVKGLEGGGRLTVKGVYEDKISTDFIPVADHCLKIDADFEAKVRGMISAEVSAFGFSKSITLIDGELSPYKKNIATWNDGGAYCSGLHAQKVAKLNDFFDKDVDCKVAEENPLIGTCVEDFMTHCFDPQGECTGLAYEDGSFDMLWDSGERFYSTVTEVESIGGGLIELPKALNGDYLGALGHCAQSKHSISLMSGGISGVPSCRVTAIITLLEGDAENPEGPQAGDVVEFCVFETGAMKFDCKRGPENSALPPWWDESTSGGSSVTLGGEDESICLQGPCKFEAGYLEDIDTNRSGFVSP